MPGRFTQTKVSDSMAETRKHYNPSPSPPYPTSRDGVISLGDPVEQKYCIFSKRDRNYRRFDFQHFGYSALFDSANLRRGGTQPMDELFDQACGAESVRELRLVWSMACTP